jgi:hypothetical protein
MLEKALLFLGDLNNGLQKEQLRLADGLKHHGLNKNHTTTSARWIKQTVDEVSQDVLRLQWQ